jgi:hypothetical protein
MKLLNGWTKALSLGLAALLSHSAVNAQGVSIPGKPSGGGVPSQAMRGQVPTQFASYPQEAGPMGGPGYPSPPMMGGPGMPMGGPGMPMGGPGMPMGGLPVSEPTAGMHFDSSMAGSMAMPGGTSMQGASCNDYAGIGGPQMECQSCGYSGCPRCGWGLALLMRNELSKFRGILSPYSEGGLADQRWFDVQVEAMMLQRSSDPANFQFSSEGISGPSVLSSSDVELDSMRAGLSLLLNLQTGPGSNLEFGYFGLNSWDNTATVDSAGGGPTLYSFLSDFGTAPAGGFDDSDRSLSHSLNYRSELHNGEINFRRRWLGPYQWFQGSWLFGVRYFDLDEQMTFSSSGLNNNGAADNGARFLSYEQQVRNQLTGAQIGSDLWLNIRPGIRAGIEWKGGVFGNHADSSTLITANSLPNAIQEGIDDGRTAYLGQFTAALSYRLSYSWAFRTSYQLIYIDNVALAPENFNATPPALFAPSAARTAQINVDGEVLYTGYTIGAEYTW